MIITNNLNKWYACEMHSLLWNMNPNNSLNQSFKAMRRRAYNSMTALPLSYGSKYWLHRELSVPSVNEDCSDSLDSFAHTVLGGLCLSDLKPINGR